jgi:hypothetical protein
LKSCSYGAGNFDFQFQIVPSSESNDEKSENRRMEIQQKREERRFQMELKRKEKGIYKNPVNAKYCQVLRGSIISVLVDMRPRNLTMVRKILK